jgi:hypothetical protein
MRLVRGRAGLTMGQSPYSDLSTLDAAGGFVSTPCGFKPASFATTTSVPSMEEAFGLKDTGTMPVGTVRGTSLPPLLLLPPPRERT